MVSSVLSWLDKFNVLCIGLGKALQILNSRIFDNSMEFNKNELLDILYTNPEVVSQTWKSDPDIGTLQFKNKLNKQLLI